MDSIDEATVAIEQSAQFHGDLQFYVLSFALACIAGLVRTYRDDKYRDIGNLVSIGIVCGLIGFACVAFLIGTSGERGDYNRPLFIAIAVFIGLGGKEADKYIPLVWEKVLKKVGIELKDPKEKPTKNDRNSKSDTS